MQDHPLHLQKGQQWSGEENNLSQIKVNHFVFEKKQLKMMHICVEWHSLFFAMTFYKCDNCCHVCNKYIYIIAYYTIYIYVFHTSEDTISLLTWTIHFSSSLVTKTWTASCEKYNYNLSDFEQRQWISILDFHLCTMYNWFIKSYGWIHFCYLSL